MSEEGSRLAPGALTLLLEQIAAPPPPDAPPGPAVGEILGRFRLEREIGRGGFGLVFEATDLELGRAVAVKVIRPGRGGAVAPAEWVRREAEAAAQLRHRGIVTLHDAGRCQDGAFLVYELLRGESLAERLLGRRLARAEARRVLTELASALAHAHAAGVVHRDLTPANVFLELDGSVKLLDLGLAQVAGAIGLPAGTPPFMAPEQGLGAPVDARADVYAWGVLAALLLDGDLPGAGQAPARPGAPLTLRALADQARAADPAQRPDDAVAVVAALQRIERRRRRSRAVGVALLATLAAGLLASPGLLRPEPPAPPPLRVAVADPVGAGDDPALQGLAELITRGVAAAPGLTVIDRARVLGVLRASGRPAGPGLDPEAVAFAARQVGGAAVLVPGALRGAEESSLSLEARDPASGEVLASAAEQVGPGTEALLPAVGRLVGTVAAALGARQREGPATEVAVDRAVTASLEAHRRYTTGLRCEEAPSRGESWDRLDCAQHFREALTFDPDFPLAHFALARGAVLAGLPTEELQAALRPALARLERVPPRERAQLVAWQAALEGKVDEAIATLRRAQADWGDDARLAYALGEALERAGRLADAVAPLTRAVELDPGLETAAEKLAWTLGRLDRGAELLALAERLAALPPYPGTVHAEIQARGWAGDVAGALRVARRGAGGGAAARQDLVEALVAAGQLAEAETLLLTPAPQPGTPGERRLATLRLLAGRRREALAALDRPLPPEAGPHARYVHGARRAWRLAATRDGAAIAAIADAVHPYSEELAASLAPVLAYAGAVEPALALAPHLAGQPGTRRLLDALVAWRRAGAAAALPDLRWAARGEGLDVTEVLPPEAPAWLAAECALEAEPGERALADLRRFQRAYRPLGPWRAWAYPRSLLLEARLLDDLGRRAEARAALARLEALWRRADADLPLVAEMRALGRRLGSGGRDEARWGAAR